MIKNNMLVSVGKELDDLRINDEWRNKLIGVFGVAALKDMRERVSILFDNDVEYDIVVKAYGDILRKDVISELYIDAQNRRREREAAERVKRDREEMPHKVVMSDTARARMEERMEDIKQQFPGAVGEYYADTYKEGFEEGYQKEKLLQSFKKLIDVYQRNGMLKEEAIVEISECYEITIKQVEDILALDEEK